jgi:hypothetical protein
VQPVVGVQRGRLRAVAAATKRRAPVLSARPHAGRLRRLAEPGGRVDPH